MLMEGNLTKQEIADKIGISRTGLWKWEYGDPEMVAELDKRKQELRTEAIEDLTKSLPKMIRGLKDIALNSQDARSKLKAIELAISYCIGRPANTLDIKADVNTTNIDSMAIFKSIIEGNDIDIIENDDYTVNNGDKNTDE